MVELTKYRLTRQDLAANLNLFSEVSTNDEGQLSLSRKSDVGDSIALRFEMDTLVIMHACPHPLNTEEAYPRKPVQISLKQAAPIETDDACLNHCDENRRGFQNNALYHMGMH